MGTRVCSYQGGVEMPALHQGTTTQEVTMVTIVEIELLAGLLARAGVTQIEAIWCNTVLERLRNLIVIEQGKQDPPEIEEK